QKDEHDAIAGVDLLDEMTHLLGDLDGTIARRIDSKASRRNDIYDRNMRSVQARGAHGVAGSWLLRFTSYRSPSASSAPSGPACATSSRRRPSSCRARRRSEASPPAPNAAVSRRWEATGRARSTSS